MRDGERDGRGSGEDQQQGESVQARVDVARGVAQVGLVLGHPLVLQQPVNDEMNGSAPHEQLGGSHRESSTLT